MRYFLAKTEPTEYSIDDLKNAGTTTWDGVTNPTAVRFLKEMKQGDKVLIYHSGKVTSIIGLAEVIGESRADPTNIKSWLVDFSFIRKFENPVTLKEIKETHLFDDSRLVHEGRLSTMDVSEKLIVWLRQKGLEI